MEPKAKISFSLPGESLTLWATLLQEENKFFVQRGISPRVSLIKAYSLSDAIAWFFSDWGMCHELPKGAKIEIEFLKEEAK